MEINLFRIITKFFIFILFLNCSFYSQEVTGDTLHNFPTFVVKGGWHNGSSNFNAGLSADFNAELPVGKNVYLGLNYDLMWGKGTYYNDYFNKTDIISNQSGMLGCYAKYKYYIKNISIYGAGEVGVTALTNEYKNYSVFGNLMQGSDLFIGWIIKSGAEYFLNRKLFIVIEPSFYYSFKTRSKFNNIFQVKTGIGYVFSK
jgi:hypothetical protein